MDFINHLADSVSYLIKPYLWQVSFAIVATLLVIYGADINGAVKKRIQRFNFVIRVMIFMLVCAFGYGFVTILLAKLLKECLDHLGGVYLAAVVCAFFFIVGILAERKRQI